MFTLENQTDPKIRETAIAAIRSAGRLIRNNRDKVSRVDHKGAIDLVTEVDLISEGAIVAVIEQNFPSHQIVAEEGGGQRQQSDYIWWVDPLDGTTNFAHGYPHYGISLALEYRGELVLGYVYDPLRDELFSAARKEGAFLNGEKISVSATGKMEESLLATGFPYNIKEHPRAVALLGKFISRVQGIRRDGAAALNLAYTAAGRLDGFWEIGLRPWDTAAGVLLVEEAGGKVSNFQGQRFDIHQREIIAGNTLLHPLLVDIIKE